MRPLLVFLLAAAAAAAAATSRRPFDWRDCNRQACYVPKACRDGDKGAIDTVLVKVAGAREVVAQHNCSFVMLIRPFTARVWVVRLRRFQQPRLHVRSIEIQRDNELLFGCEGLRDGSVNVTARIDKNGGDQTLKTETYAAASYSTLTELHCAFTVTKATGTLDTASATAVFSVATASGQRRLSIASLGDVMDYVTCDGSKVTQSSLKPAGRVDVVPVDTSRPDLACPDSTWTLMIERNGKLQPARAARCDKVNKGVYKYELDFENDDLLLLDEFKALCVAPLSCKPPTHLDCPGCARVRHRPGNKNGSVPARLRCPDPGHKDKFFIANRAYVDVVPSCEKRTDGKYGWSITDEYNKTVQFDAAACVGRVSCHDTHPIQLKCDDNATCVEPLFVDFDSGEEGALCPDGLGMRFRSNDSEEWTTDAAEVVCDARNGYWFVERGANRTKLGRNATVGCVALPDPIVYWGTIAVACLVALLYLVFLPHYLWTRKSDAEYDKNWRELSKKFRAIKTWPKSLEKSEKSQKEKSRQSEVKEVGKPIVDTRIYPDELTLKRKVTEKKKAPAALPARPLRKREKPDKKSAFCKSQKSAGKEAWTRWIKETGGIIQEKKPREEVLRIRAEKKAAKEKKAEEKKRAEEEKKRLEEEARKPKPKPAARSVECGTDKFLMQQKVSGKDAFGPLITPLSTTPLAVTPLKAVTGTGTGQKTGTGAATGKKRQYKKNIGHSKDAEIKFEAPTTTNDASVLQITAPSRDKVYMTAEEPLRGSTAHSTPYSTDARDRTPTVTDDRAVETDGSKMSKHSVLPSHVKDVAVEGTEDKTKKTKKRKGGGKKKSGGGSNSGGGSDETPKEFTARDQDDAPVQTAVDVERGSGKRKSREKSTALMTAPSPRTPATPHNTGKTATDPKRKRKKRGAAGTAEAKGPKKRSGSGTGGGNKKAAVGGGRTTTSPKDAVKKE